MACRNAADGSIATTSTAFRHVWERAASQAPIPAESWPSTTLRTRPGSASTRVVIYGPSQGSWDGVSSPDPDRGHVDGALVDELPLVVPGGDSPVLLELAEAALDGVAVFVALPVEGGRLAGGAAAVAAACFLVFLDRDDGLDPALAQVTAVGGGGVRLIAHRGTRPGPGTAVAPAADADRRHERDEPRAVTMLAWGEDPGEGPAAPVRGQVDLGVQPAAGPARPAPPAGGFLSFAGAPPGQVRGQGAAGPGGMLVRPDHGGIGASRLVLALAL